MLVKRGTLLLVFVFFKYLRGNQEVVTTYVRTGSSNLLHLLNMRSPIFETRLDHNSSHLKNEQASKQGSEPFQDRKRFSSLAIKTTFVPKCQCVNQAIIHP